MKPEERVSRSVKRSVGVVSRFKLIDRTDRLDPVGKNNDSAVVKHLSWLVQCENDPVFDTLSTFMLVLTILYDIYFISWYTL